MRSVYLLHVCNESVQRKKQLGGERVYCLISDSDVIRQSFVRGIK